MQGKLSQKPRCDLCMKYRLNPAYQASLLFGALMPAQRALTRCATQHTVKAMVCLLEDVGPLSQSASPDCCTLVSELALACGQ